MKGHSDDWPDHFLDPDEAAEILRYAGFAYSESELLVVELPKEVNNMLG